MGTCSSAQPWICSLHPIFSFELNFAFCFCAAISIVMYGRFIWSFFSELREYELKAKLWLKFVLVRAIHLQNYTICLSLSWRIYLKFWSSSWVNHQRHAWNFLSQFGRGTDTQQVMNICCICKFWERNRLWERPFTIVGAQRYYIVLYVLCFLLDTCFCDT
jgi:hypothetical protein